MVVEATGLNDRGWLDGFGHPAARNAYDGQYRRDFGDLDLKFCDPTYYTRPFKLEAAIRLIPDSDLIEYVCSENEKDRTHLGK